MVVKHVDKYVTKELAMWLKPSGTTTGKLYGTCKVHKEGYPVRPIVSMVNTPEYNLAKYLDSLIKPHIPMEYAITSSCGFLRQFKIFEQQDDDLCISFDVVSLFTNVPLDFTINLIANELYCKPNHMKPPMPKLSFVELLRCATGGIFSYQTNLCNKLTG